MVRRPSRRHSQLHTYVPHVLREHRFPRRRQARRRRDIRPNAKPTLLIVPWPWRMAERNDPFTLDQERKGQRCGR